MSVVHQLEISDKEFKKIKKNKLCILMRLNDEENSKIKVKDKIILHHNGKKIKKKVKKLHQYSNFEELIENVDKKKLGYKKKESISHKDFEDAYSQDDIKKYGVLGIEINRKKKIFRKILLGLIVIVTLFISFSLISGKINEIKAKKFNNNLTELFKEKTDFVFVEINPYLLLHVKNNEVIKTTCLNEDCKKIYDELSLENKNINESINIIYNVSKEKGFDTSNGVNIKTTGNVEIKEESYIKIEYISEATKNEIISNIEEVDIDNTSNEDYYNKLWNELKKDPDYDKLYTCEIENDELYCYLTWRELSSETDIFTKQKRFSEIKYILEKFGIKTESDSDHGFSFDASFIYIDNVKFEWGGLCDTHVTPLPNNGGFVGTDLGYYNDYSYKKDGKLYCTTLVKETYGINLVNPSSIWERARVIDDPINNIKMSESVTIYEEYNE